MYAVLTTALYALTDATKMLGALPIGTLAETRQSESLENLCTAIAGLTEGRPLGREMLSRLGHLIHHIPTSDEPGR
jgi:hypothetical protein